ncbi:MAG TPA: potassium channel family protein, partial [Pyrinomonadaceae bacterium]|nr:potassium channel family protein [Pyrinomonadaceae bacterium]
HVMIGVVGASLVAIVLWETFETIILPRRVTRRVRLTRLLYLLTWQPWLAIAQRIQNNRRKEKLLSFFGPLSLIMLLTVWALALVLGFALIHLAVGQFGEVGVSAGLREALYFSGSTFFTLGLGDVTHANTTGRAITIVEAGTGIGFFAMVISYLPVLYQAFSRREVNISMLDARAGTPPTAGELLRRYREAGEMESLDHLLRDWERWSADLLESHLSYPVLCFFRSQHDNQSWLAALSTVLDTCSLVMVGIDGVPKWQAQLTFKMTRHAVVDLAQVFNTSPLESDGARLSTEELARLRTVLSECGVQLRNEPGDEKILAELREMYEPYIKVLSRYLLMPLPGWLPKPKATDNWQTSAWELTAPAREEPFRKCMQDAKSKRFRATAAATDLQK